jgi:hypothetical protein
MVQPNATGSVPLEQNRVNSVADRQDGLQSPARVVPHQGRASQVRPRSPARSSRYKPARFRDRLDGIICILIPLKGRVRVSFAAGASLPDPKKLFNAQLNGMSRAIDFPVGSKIDVAGLEALVRAGVKQRIGAKRNAAKAAKAATRKKAVR